MQGQRRDSSSTSYFAMGKRRLDKVPYQSSISRIVSKADQYAAFLVYTNASTKRRRPAAAPRLRKAHFQWLSDKKNSGTAFNSNIVKFHASKLLEKGNALLLDKKMYPLSSQTDGWSALKCSRV